MAAGLGSRFGGLKQLTPITSDGKSLMDFSVYDAIKAGFSRIVFIIREDMLADFKHLIGDRLSQKISVSYVIQDMSDLPPGRIKPFGTAHAIYCCKDIINSPFAVINADDYYGPNAFKIIYNHLIENKTWAMLAYNLRDTLSDNGTVNRGVCKISNTYLDSIIETYNINNKGIYELNGNKILLPDNTIVSMNIWGFTPEIFDLLFVEYNRFLAYNKIMYDEFSLPNFVCDMIRNYSMQVKVYTTRDRWCGITYKEDLQEVKDVINNLIENNYYEGI